MAALRKSSESERSNNSSPAGQEEGFWAGIGRTGYPEPCTKQQPWKETGVGPTEEKSQTGRWNILGAAWTSVVCTMEYIIDLGTGRTW